MKKLIPILGLLFISACGGGGGGPVPNVVGNYALTNISPNCLGLFDPAVVVSQNNENIIVQATQIGFQDANGTIDGGGNFDLSGGSGQTSFSCSGVFTSSAATGVCSIGGVNCNITYTKQ